MVRMLGLLMVVALTIGAAGAGEFALALWQGYARYRPVVMAPLRPQGAGTTQPLPAANAALSQRVFVICVRGMRADIAQGMRALTALRERGADYTLQLDEPLFSRPQMMTLLTGATAEFHGLTAEEASGEFADHVFARAAQARMTTAMIADPWWDGRLGRQIIFEPNDIAGLPERDASSARSAIAQFNDPANRANLMWLELRLLTDVVQVAPGDLDKAIAATDAQLALLLAQLDLNRTTVIVMADRGLPGADTDTAEVLASRVPLLMAGPGVRSGARGATRAVNVAPTLATLLGLQTPAQAQGTPIFAALLIPPEQLDLHADAQSARLVALYERWAEAVRRPRFASEVLQAQDGAARADPARWLRNFELALSARYEQERGVLLAAGERFRMPFAVGVALCLVALAGALAARFRFAPWLAVPAFWALWIAVFRATSPLRDSLTNFGDGNADAFIAGMLRSGTWLWAALLSIVVLAAARQRDPLHALNWCMGAVLATVIGMLLPVALFVVRSGSTFEHALPDGSSLSLAITLLAHVAALNASIDALPFRLPLAIVAGAASMLLSVIGVGGRRRR